MSESDKQEPTLEEWRRLYDAAIAFRDLSPGNWMRDGDIFSVINPETGMAGYCMIAGPLGDFIGMGLYRGAQGLSFIKRIFAGDRDLHPFTLEMTQDCLVVVFTRRGDLHKRDIEIIRRLGLKFRGPKSWPLFRSYLPNHYPWHLTADEARFLATGLEQAVHVASRFRDDPTLFDPPDSKGGFFTRVFEHASNEWEDDWRHPAVSEMAEAKPRITPDPERLRRLHARPRASNAGSWEVDLVLSPVPVREGNARPYHPMILLCVDHLTGFARPPEVVKKADEILELIPEAILSLLESLPAPPRQIFYRTNACGHYLREIAEPLNVKIIKSEKLPVIDEIWDSMNDHMPGGQ